MFDIDQSPTATREFGSSVAKQHEMVPDSPPHEMQPTPVVVNPMFRQKATLPTTIHETPKIEETPKI